MGAVGHGQRLDMSPSASPIPPESSSGLPPGHARFLLVLGISFALVTLRSGIGAHQLKDWWMEHIAVAAGLSLLGITARWFVFSKTSYLLFFGFLCLHALGAHYTYSEVPYREWWAQLTGQSMLRLGEDDRNHFDRLVHFLYGLLCARPMREAFYFAMRPRRDFWSHLVVISFLAATSLLYEFAEWGAALYYGGEAGMAFLGIQGDVWDAHKDMLLATTGALLSCLGMALRACLSKRDAARGWGERQRDLADARSSSP